MGNSMPRINAALEQLPRLEHPVRNSALPSTIVKSELQGRTYLLKVGGFVVDKQNGQKIEACHLAVFIDVAGASQYDNGVNHPPTRFNGVVFHLGLQHPRNRATKLFVETVIWREAVRPGAINPKTGTVQDGRMFDDTFNPMLDDLDPGRLAHARMEGNSSRVRSLLSYLAPLSSIVVSDT